MWTNVKAWVWLKKLQISWVFHLNCTTHLLPLSCLLKPYVGTFNAAEVVKRAVGIISGFQSRTYTDPLATEPKLLKCAEINNYLVGLLL